MQQFFKRHGSTLFIGLIFFVGLSLLLYPTFSNYYNSFHSTRSIARYEKKIQEISNEEFVELKELANVYNQKRLEYPTSFEGGKPVDEEYKSLLSMDDDGMMGYITINRIGVRLPIYHGTAENVLANGVGHLEGSSLPIGGKGTHTILTGHRGLPSARLFTDLDKLEEGDTFHLNVLDETITYRVDQIRIVEPEELRDLEIEKDKDYCTLVTCTPYGLNTHRLLVRGTRISDTGINESDIANASMVDPLLVAPVVAVPLVIVLFVVLLKRKKKEEMNHE